MAENDENTPEEKETTVAISSENNSEDSSESTISDEGKGLIQSLFCAGNKLLTLPNSQAISIGDDTRRLLALFADGRFLVVETHKFDGRVMSFQVLAKRKGLRFGKPIFVSQNELNAIYAYGERSAPVELSEKEVEENQLQMQRDFVNVVARAAAVKVSDIHVVVADSTQIMFRVNGMMTTVMEYDGSWGESFVRAAFASADISDSNYTQNEFQGAQKLGATPLRGSNGKLMLPHNVLAIRLQFNPIAFGSQYLVMRLLYADDNPDGSGDLSSLGFGEYEENLF